MTKAKSKWKGKKISEDTTPVESDFSSYPTKFKELSKREKYIWAEAWERGWIVGDKKGYEQGKRDQQKEDIENYKEELSELNAGITTHGNEVRKQTLEEVLKDLVIQEDLYEKDDKQKELLALYRFRIKLGQKIETMK